MRSSYDLFACGILNQVRTILFTGLNGTPRLRQQHLNGFPSCCREMHYGLFISGVNLKDQFSASSARWQYFPMIGYRDDLFYLGLLMFQHLGYRRMFGAKSDAAASINTDTRINIPLGSYKRGTDTAAARQLAQFSAFTDPAGLFVKRGKIIHK